MYNAALVMSVRGCGGHCFNDFLAPGKVLCLRGVGGRDTRRSFGGPNPNKVGPIFCSMITFGSQFWWV